MYVDKYPKILGIKFNFEGDLEQTEREDDLFGIFSGKRPAHYIVLSFKLYESLLLSLSLSLSRGQEVGSQMNMTRVRQRAILGERLMHEEEGEERAAAEREKNAGESGRGGSREREGPLSVVLFRVRVRFVFQSIMSAESWSRRRATRKAYPMIVGRKREKGRRARTRGTRGEMFRGYLRLKSRNILLLPRANYRAGRAPEPLPINLSPRWETARATRASEPPLRREESFSFSPPLRGGRN